MKGDWNQECNRTDCSNNKAVYYNHSTRKYYCKHCSSTLNTENYWDAQRLFGHDLCTKVSEDQHLDELVGEIIEEKCPIVSYYMDSYLSLKKSGIFPKVKPLRGIKIPVRTEPKIGRNSKCVCGSGKKYKHCCLIK